MEKDEPVMSPVTVDKSAIVSIRKVAEQYHSGLITTREFIDKVTFLAYSE